ncbi:MAG: DinB family protein [Nocardioides sp.]
MTTPPTATAHEHYSAHHSAELRELQNTLDGNRAEVLATLDGLSEAQVRCRLVPSLTTLLGLVKHAAFAEAVWFQVTLAGGNRDELGVPHQIDDSFTLSEHDTIESITAHFHETVAISRRIAAEHDLDHRVTHHRLGSVSLRWIHLHMIEELARHAGHADILREQILATDQ